MTACNTKSAKHPEYGQGGKNACQFVKEQAPGLSDDIASVEIIGEDSLLSDIGMSFAEVELARSGTAFMSGEISADRYRAIIDSISNDATDVNHSWVYSTVNDSLRMLGKYEGQWRKVYTVRIAMKSGTVKEPRVLMDVDGVTPRMTEKGMERAINNFTRRIIEAERLLR